MSLMRSMHGGEDYRSEWKVRQRGEWPYAQLVAARFHKACAVWGLAVSRRNSVRTDLFKPPTLKESGAQMGIVSTKPSP
jgi:hypothetical protein